MVKHNRKKPLREFTFGKGKKSDGGKYAENVKNNLDFYFVNFLIFCTEEINNVENIHPAPCFHIWITSDLESL